MAYRPYVSTYETLIYFYRPEKKRNSIEISQNLVVFLVQFQSHIRANRSAKASLRCEHYWCESPIGLCADIWPHIQAINTYKAFELFCFDSTFFRDMFSNGFEEQNL
jgi:hypothetical protein